MEDLQFQNFSRTRQLRAFPLIVLLGSVMFIGCSSGTDKPTRLEQAEAAVPAISVMELKQLIDAGQDIFLLDVRRDSEFVAERLSSADLRITHDSLEFNLARLPQDKATGIYCFCRGGVRSARATRYLLSVGYLNVYNVAGGMLAWKENGFETVSGSAD